MNQFFKDVIQFLLMKRKNLFLATITQKYKIVSSTDITFKAISEERKIIIIQIRLL